MRKSIITEVTVSEMLRLREEHNLSNSEIAERLDLCDATVRRYIGNNPKGIRKVRSTTNPDFITSSPFTRDTEKEPVLIQLSCQHRVTMGGKYFCYEVNRVDGNVVIKARKPDAPPVTPAIDKSELEVVIAELLDLLKLM